MRLISRYNHLQVVFSFFHISKKPKKKNRCSNSRPFLATPLRPSQLFPIDLKEEGRWKQPDWSGNLKSAKFFRREVGPTRASVRERVREEERKKRRGEQMFLRGWGGSGPDWGGGGVSCDHNWTTFSLPLFLYNNVHFLFFLLTGGGHSTARMASSNTVLRPRCVRAEHSRYFTAPVGKHRGEHTTLLLLFFISLYNNRDVSVTVFNKMKAIFVKLCKKLPFAGFFNYKFFIAIFRFCTILRAIEAQLMTKWR